MKFYIRVGGAMRWKLVKGRPVPAPVEGCTFGLHKGVGEWMVTNIETGRVMATGRHPEDAIDLFRRRSLKAGWDKIVERIQATSPEERAPEVPYPSLSLKMVERVQDMDGETLRELIHLAEWELTERSFPG